MRRAWKIILGMVAGLIALPLVALLALVLFVAIWLPASAPDDDGLALSTGGAVRADVAITLDARGIPTIRADSMEDAMFALGFMHARDRLWQMEMNRIVGQGRMSEIVGHLPIASYAMKFDRLMRTMGFAHLAEASVENLPDAARGELDAYTAGVNHWLETNERPLPPEFWLTWHEPGPWQPADSLIWSKLMAFQLSSNMRDEITRARLLTRLSPAQIRDLYPPEPENAHITLPDRASGQDDRAEAPALPPGLPPGIDAILPDLPLTGPQTASNAWTISPGMSASGHAILANDPHLKLDTPVLWYLVNIVTPDLHLTGATVPGVPFLVIGTNHHIAWGLTTTGGDVQDIFIERIAPDDPNSYLTADGPQPFETRLETINVRGNDPVRLSVRTTRNGPVISDIDPDMAAGILETGHVAALAWTGLDPADDTAEALWRLNRARNHAEFMQAMRHWHSPQQNIFYADKNGITGMIAPAAIPVRKAGDGTAPVPGWTGEYDWTGRLAFEDLPQYFSTDTAWIGNGNNRIVGDDYPHFITAEWDSPWRGMRVAEILGTARSHDVAASAAMLADNRSVALAAVIPVMLDEIADMPALWPDGLLEEMRAWDFTMQRDLVPPGVASLWLTKAGDAIFADEPGAALADEFGAMRPESMLRVLDSSSGAREWCDDVTTPEKAEDCPARLALALEETLAELTTRYGENWRQWQWRKMHRAPLKHQLFARIPVVSGLLDISQDVDGGRYTLNRAAGWKPDGDLLFPANHGAGMRMIIDFADTGAARWVIAGGQSGNPFSQHYGDLAPVWASGRHITIGGTDAGEQGRLTLTP